MQIKFYLTSGFLSSVLTVVSASAGVIPYPNTGMQNATTYTLTALATADVIAYFTGSGAAYTETLGLNVNGVSTGITGLNNHTSALGQSLDLGHANAGDALTFFINVQNTGNTWYSNQSLNTDGANHVYSTDFSGNGTIPAGTYVGFEDLAAGVTDWNYTDEQFVFTNTTAVVGSVPEPTSVALFGLGLAGLTGLLGRSGRRGSRNA
jgi:hypothetical protein